ncbi:AsmA family protein [Pseudogemmobacter humi]|uniref:Putative assembly protein n=1 Tax=Pseudogemmobacter humi TaxID=2483812 RepID=A0A3P5XIT8_9RHOB|nr:AsmA family protein [Pseudogemmobacter humi]VDC28652.1 putative assembly protein [Pseudogemmobacter humi]
MRWLFRILGALLLLVVIAVGVVLMIPTERVAQMAADQFQRLTGRELRIEGDVSPRFWPVLGVKTGPVTIANAAWSEGEEPMFAADGLTIGINAAALMGGEVKILDVSADRPRLLLERARDGRENWVFGGGGEAGEIGAGTPGVGRSWTLERGLIEGGTLRFIDHAAGRDITFDGVDAELKIPDFAGAFSFAASGIVSGQRVSVTGEGGVFSAFTEGRVVPVTLKAVVGGASAEFRGRAGWQPMAAEGALTADLSDLAALAALTGSAVSAPPEGFGARKLALNSQMVLDDKGALYLRGAKIEADGNVFSGDLDLVQGGPRPKLSGNLRGGALDLKGVSGGEGGGQGGGMKAEGWPGGHIDVSALGTLDAEVSIGAASVDLGAVKFGETRLILTIERARAVFDIRQMAAYGGSVTGEFVVNGRGGLSVGGNLTLAAIDAQPLLLDLAGWDRLITKANLSLKFLGVGNSVDEIMQGLSGEGSLSLGKGEIRGLDIAGMLRTLDTSYVGEGQKTIFDGVAGSFTIKDGDLANSDLKLVAPYLTATGAGRIGLGARDLDYRIRPTAFPGEGSTGGVMVPLRITGSWADPTYRLDLESIAREKMEAEAKAAGERARQEAKEAEARAKAELEARLRDELGVIPTEGESVEDAARRRAREALEAETGRLLGDILGRE